jgi:hypothetical protein
MSVQVATLSQLQTAITSYLNGWTDSLGNVWPGVLPTFFPPPLPLAIWAFEGGPRPIPPYLSMNHISARHVGQGYQSPAVPLRDGNGNVIGYGQGVFWNEDPEISFQAYGAAAPDILGFVHDSLEAPWFYDSLEGLGLVARGHSEPRDISLFMDGTSPERRWVMEITFGIPREIDNLQTGWIEFAQITENYGMPDTTPSAPDILTVGPVTIGQ